MRLIDFYFNRDGLHESNVVTKTFQVEDVGPPDDDSSLLDVDVDPWADDVPKTSKSYLRSGLNKKKVSKPNNNFAHIILCPYIIIMKPTCGISLLNKM